MVAVISGVAVVFTSQLDYIQRGFHTPDVVQPFHMCKNGEFELEVKTTATPEITTTMFDGDGTDQWTNGDSIFTVVFFQHYNSFVTS
jgi:hypothetical protein